LSKFFYEKRAMSLSNGDIPATRSDESC